MMETHREIPEVLETIYTKDDLKRAHDSEQPTVENTDTPVFSKAILKMVEKMQKGSIADNNKRSRKIVKAVNKERKKMERENKKAAKVVKLLAKPVQRTIADFGGN